MNKFEKFLKSAIDKKAPENWGKIEAAAKENMPRQERKKRNFKFVYSPASLVICAVIVVAAIALVPQIDRIFHPVPVSTTTASVTVNSSSDLSGDTESISSVSNPISTTATTTAATTMTTTAATKSSTPAMTTIETTSDIETAVTSTKAPEYIYEIRYSDFENVYGSYTVKYKFYTNDSVKGKMEIVGITVNSGSEFLLECAFILEGESVSLPAEIFIENKTGAPLKKLIFAEGIKSVFAEVSDGAESIYIPASLENTNPSHKSSGTSVFFADNLTRIDVSGESNTYASENGVLFSKDKLSLIRFPAAHAEKNYRIPTGTEDVATYAFLGADLESLTVPESVSYLYLENLRINKLCLPATYVKISWGENSDVEEIIAEE